jgi:MFS family permease
MGKGFRRLLAVVFVFALANSSDTFILLRLTELGLSPEGVALAWMAHNLVRTAVVYVGGGLADRVERRRLLGGGWAIYVLLYVGFALATSVTTMIALLVVYALHYGAVEATERALIADLAPPELRGSAFGWYHATVGFAALPASAAFGAIWSASGARWAFAISAGLAACALGALLIWVPAVQRHTE